MLEDVIMLNQTTNGDELIKPTDDFPAIIVITCMLSVFSVVGTTGNAFVLYVFSRKKDKNTSTVFILALASIDFVTCIFVIPFTIFVEFMYKQVGNDALCKIYQFFITSNVPFSAFIMVAIAFDRYFCICRPWMKVINIRVAKKIILCLLALALSLGLITSLAYGVYHRKIITKVRRDNTDEVNDLISASAATCLRGLNDSTYEVCVDKHIFNISVNVATSIESTSMDTLSTPIVVNMSLTTNDFIFTGFCFPNEAIFSIAFKRVYQKFYASLFLIAFIIVFILYALIYRSILTRRSKRLHTSLSEKQPSRMRSAVLTSIFAGKNQVPETLIRISKNADVNKSNQGGNNTNSFQMTVLGVDKRPPDTEITFCPNDLKTDITRATSCNSFYSISAVDDNSTVERGKDDEHMDENSHVRCTTPDTCRRALTSNSLAVPAPVAHAKRKRTNKHRHAGQQGQLYSRVCVDDTLTAGVEECPETRQVQETHRTTTFNVYRQDTRKSVREKHRLANIKTAGILFIVTLVFILAFLPAWLMATKIIGPNMIVFYSYFIYNVANPVIYAFFNQSFQKEMKTVLICVRKD